MLDLRIDNGIIVDGSGGPRRGGSVGVRDGRIVAVGEVKDDAREVVDAAGKVVAPGFVDMHTHYDAQVFWDPYLSPSCFHGVTTILGGFCGFSIAPLTPEAAPYLLRMLARVEGMPLESLKQGTPWDWTSFGSYLDRLEGDVGVNVGFFCGHSAIRRVVMGERAVGEAATLQEVEAMKALLAQSIREGALGFSTTTSPAHHDGENEPVPSRWASREEFLALAEVVRNHEGAAVEMNTNTYFPQDAIDLLIDVSLAAQRPVNWNLIFVIGSDQATRERIAHQMSVADQARARGAEVLGLTVPHTPTMWLNFYSGAGLDSLPGWDAFFKNPRPNRLELLKDPEVRAQMKASAATDLKGYVSRFEDFTVSTAFSESTRKFQGRRIGEIAAELGRDPFDVMVDIVIADDLKTSFMTNLGGEDAATYRFRAEIWHDDRVLVGASDAGAHLDQIDTFALSSKFLGRGVREFGVISLEEAVHQLTARPCRFMGIKDRGELAEGKFADIVIFDPDTIGAGETYTRMDLPGEEGRLYADAKGVEQVFVNGVRIIENGVHTQARPGTVMRSGRDTYTVHLNDGKPVLERQAPVIPPARMTAEQAAV